MTIATTQVRFVKECDGIPDQSTWQFSEESLLPPDDKEVNIKLHYLSIDPAMKGWITRKRSYIEPVALGDVMRGFGVAEVLESRSKFFKPGDFCTGFTGIRTHGTLNQRHLRKIDPELAPLNHYMSGLGMPGYTAYFGLLDIGKPQEGETVVVSAASGAVGHIVCQIAKLKGCRVIGIAGGPEKCAYLRNELGVDGVIDYKTEDLQTALKVHAPDGIDVYFDGVGGETLDSVLTQINRHARLVICGAISQYGDMHNMKGPGNYMQLIAQSGTMQGFTMRDYMARIPEAFMAIYQWHQAGKIQFHEHILEGIEQFPEAVQMVFNGKNHGKLMIKV